MKSIAVLFFCIGFSSLASGDRNGFNRCMGRCFNGNNGVYDVQSFKKVATDWKHEEGWTHVKDYCSRNVYPYTHSLMSCADSCDHWDTSLSDLLLSGMHLIVESCDSPQKYYQAEDCKSEKSPEQPIFDFQQHNDACSMASSYADYINNWMPSCASGDKMTKDWINYEMEEQLARWSMRNNWEYKSVGSCSH